MQAHCAPSNQILRGLLYCSVIASLYTMNSDTLSDSITLSSGKRSRIESVRYVSSDKDNLCASSQTQMKIFVPQEEDIASTLINHKKRPVRLHITAVKRHVSRIELEEIAEEYE